jgi:hypothetical protein
VGRGLLAFDEQGLGLGQLHAVQPHGGHGAQRRPVQLQKARLTRQFSGLTQAVEGGVGQPALAIEHAQPVQAAGHRRFVAQAAAQGQRLFDHLSCLVELPGPVGVARQQAEDALPLGQGRRRQVGQHLPQLRQGFGVAARVGQRAGPLPPQAMPLGRLQRGVGVEPLEFGQRFVGTPAVAEQFDAFQAQVDHARRAGAGCVGPCRLQRGFSGQRLRLAALHLRAAQPGVQAQRRVGGGSQHGVARHARFGPGLALHRDLRRQQVPAGRLQRTIGLVEVARNAPRLGVFGDQPGGQLAVQRTLAHRRQAVADGLGDQVVRKAMAPAAVGQQQLGHRGVLQRLHHRQGVDAGGSGQQRGPQVVAGHAGRFEHPAHQRPQRTRARHHQVMHAGRHDGVTALLQVTQRLDQEQRVAGAAFDQPVLVGLTEVAHAMQQGAGLVRRQGRHVHGHGLALVQP